MFCFCAKIEYDNNNNNNKKGGQNELIDSVKDTLKHVYNIYNDNNVLVNLAQKCSHWTVLDSTLIVECNIITFN